MSDVVPRRGGVALAALVGILGITAAWWALALWPSGGDAPAWLERTREVCFGVTNDGLPHAGGWIVLIGEPIGMLGFLLTVWGDDLRVAMGALRRGRTGRATIAVASLTIMAGVGGAVARVAAAAEASRPFERSGEAAPPDRLDRPAAALALVDQRGDTVRLEHFAGRPVLVVFAYGHCETVCPLIVKDAALALERAAAPDAQLLVVTLDPWRDTPARLPFLANLWQLPAGARLLGGSVGLVERTLDDWGIARRRDARTGEIVHPTQAYLIDRQGRLAYVASGTADHLATLVSGL